MVYQSHDRLLDGALQVKDAGLVAATAVTTVSSSAVTIDLGAAATYQKGALVVDVTACEVASGDELYIIQIQGATDSAFTTAHQLAVKYLGDSSVTGNAVDTPPTGRHVLYFDNVALTSATDGTAYNALRYLRVRTVASGTIATGINYSAWMALL